MAVYAKGLQVLGARTAPPPSHAMRSAPLYDPQARRISYLRVSITDRCNFRCHYCLPESATTPVQFSPAPTLLTVDELHAIVAEFVALGVRKVRLTGGEPTLRPNLAPLVARLTSIPGLRQLVMTTNGARLAHDGLLRRLVDAGLQGLHVSLDSLDAARFRVRTGVGNLTEVQAGIREAARLGVLRGLNIVAFRETLEEAPALCEYAWAHGAVPRFIEPMPMAAGSYYNMVEPAAASGVREVLTRAFGPLVTQPGAGQDAGPARYLTTAAAQTVGIISPITEHFCSDCNRLRITATGDLHACLGHDDAVSLRDVLRGGGDAAALRAAIAHGVAGKRDGHTFEATGAGGPRKHMISVGG